MYKNLGFGMQTYDAEVMDFYTMEFNEARSGIKKDFIVDDAARLRWADAAHRYHRMGDLPSCVNVDHKCFFWMQNGVLHRISGPAVISQDGEVWFYHGVKHRLDGPAQCNDQKREWFIHGKQITNTIHEWAISMSIDLDNLTEDDKTLISLIWGNHT